MSTLLRTKPTPENALAPRAYPAPVATRRGLSAPSISAYTARHAPTPIRANATIRPPEYNWPSIILDMNATKMGPHMRHTLNSGRGMASSAWLANAAEMVCTRATAVSGMTWRLNSRTDGSVVDSLFSLSMVVDKFIFAACFSPSFLSHLLDRQINTSDAIALVSFCVNAYTSGKRNPGTFLSRFESYKLSDTPKIKSKIIMAGTMTADNLILRVHACMGESFANRVLLPSSYVSSISNIRSSSSPLSSSFISLIISFPKKLA
mmetsp:Transcript_6377/g.12129  ORF Transcript_6377/g.12129 Transcript_6377/m.12129 type:complete len:263 (-) Transcript_6377:248-1036(-)